MNDFFSIGIGKALVALLALCVFPMALTSCSDDDDEGGDDGNFDSPAYAEYAAKYNVNGGGYESIELTEAGNYIITMSGSMQAMNRSAATTDAKTRGFASKINRPTILTRNAAPATRVYSHILYGKYTVGADGVFNLAGFGTLRITHDGTGNTYNLEITPTGGTTTTIEATIQSADKNSTKSNSLCRTWNMTGARFFYQYNGQTIFDVSGNSPEELLENIRKVAQENDPEYDPSDYDEIEDILPAWPEQVVFTKTGTYVVYYTGNELAVSTWAWVNEADGLIAYSWSNQLGEPDGFVQAEFKDGKLYITETETDDYEGQTDTIGWVYILTEAK